MLVYGSCEKFDNLFYPKFIGIVGLPALRMLSLVNQLWFIMLVNSWSLLKYYIKAIDEKFLRAIGMINHIHIHIHINWMLEEHSKNWKITGLCKVRTGWRMADGR